MNSPNLILASTSRYRAALFQRLGLPFDQAAPNVDETAVAGEDPGVLAARLARAKAAAIALSHPDAVVIGSDQVATLGGHTIGKPGTREAAIAQLSRASGRDVTFLTAVAVHTPGRILQHMDVTRVAFRTLSTPEIERYVDAEQPLDCAGSFKAEGLGITLFEHLEARDPTGLIGLPLIWVAKALRVAGYRLP